MDQTIYASFTDESQAEKAVGALLDNGVRAEDINVVRSSTGTQYHTEFSEDGPAITTRVTGADVQKEGADIENAGKKGLSTTTPADAGAGAVKGIGWGAGVGVIAAIAALAVPGVGLVLGGGALAAALGGIAASAGAGAAAGAVTGYLKDQGMDEHVAADYERNISNGGALLSVVTPSGKADTVTIRETLEKFGAVGANQYSRGYVS